MRYSPSEQLSRATINIEPPISSSASENNQDFFTDRVGEVHPVIPSWRLILDECVRIVKTRMLSGSDLPGNSDLSDSAFFASDPQSIYTRETSGIQRCSNYDVHGGFVNQSNFERKSVTSIVTPDLIDLSVDRRMFDELTDLGSPANKEDDHR